MSSSCAPFSIELSDFLSDIVTDARRGLRGVAGGCWGSWGVVVGRGGTWGAGAGCGGCGVRGREQGTEPRGGMYEGFYSRVR